MGSPVRPTLVRIEGWEGRLTDVVEDARRRPFVWGEHDCFTFACNAVRALTLFDVNEFKGKYDDERGALKLMHKHGHNMREAFDWFFGRGRLPVQFARRGDICLAELIDGRSALLVCIGQRCCGPDESGMVFHPTMSMSAVWRIG